MWRERMSQVFDALSVVVLIGAVALAVSRWRDQTPERGAGWNTLPRAQEYVQRGIRVGSTSAGVHLVEFSDFQCPYCKSASVAVRAFMERYPGQVQLTFRHFPLHKPSTEAARASVCADRQGRFLVVHDALFERSDRVRVEPVASVLRDVPGLDIPAWERCMQSAESYADVLADSLAAEDLGVRGTPMFVVDGKGFMGDPGTLALDSIAAAHGLVPRQARR